ncbi:hypothetical protein MUDAN_BIHEEGNE_03217 [Lactiplantibacillus mudanjiangensis]|uniref:hypothetical protein n=1 Tax=Lactiplantibacillus mudanjiangensis TaxID=1296538 RepID=UPI001015596D|nr:hypothetical protein MUDAN_BIHEEGNE_03217 [Lactiplantibacillus mudanjiangensis]
MIFVVMVQRGKQFSTDKAFTSIERANAYIYMMNHSYNPDGFRYLQKTILDDKKPGEKLS